MGIPKMQKSVLGRLRAVRALAGQKELPHHVALRRGVAHARAAAGARRGRAGVGGGQSNFGENMVLAIKCLQISGWRKEIRVETKAWQLSAWQFFK